MLKLIHVGVAILAKVGEEKMTKTMHRMPEINRFSAAPVGATGEIRPTPSSTGSLFPDPPSICPVSFKSVQFPDNITENVYIIQAKMVLIETVLMHLRCKILTVDFVFASILLSLYLIILYNFTKISA